MNDHTNDILKIIMERIKTERIKQNLKQEDLAQKCGWGKEQAGRISNYERLSRRADIGQIHEMANALGLSLKKILFGEEEPCSKWVEVPILTMDDIKNNGLKHLNNIKDHVMQIALIDDQRALVGLFVEGDAMDSPLQVARSICDGDIVLVEDITASNLKPRHKDVVVVMIDGSVKVREYFKDGSETFLKAFNKDYPSIAVNDSVKILGVVREKRRIN